MESRAPYYLFVAVDTYAHIKRNFLGFKNRKGKIEERICALSMSGLDGNVLAVDSLYSASIKGVKLKDDPEYKNRPIDPAYYGHPKSGRDIIEHMERVRKLHTGRYVIHDSQFDLFSQFAENNGSFLEEYGHRIVPFQDVMARLIITIPTSYFAEAMGGGILEDHMTLEQDAKGKYPEIPGDTKVLLFRSHIRYPKFLDTDRALTRSIKMTEAYNLVNSVLSKYMKQ